MNVFVLQHTNIINDDEEDIKFIGVYSTAELARLALERTKLLPGFSDRPDGFSIDNYKVDKDNWTEGYITA